MAKKKKEARRKSFIQAYITTQKNRLELKRGEN